jgi:hypothetical protein
VFKAEQRILRFTLVVEKLFKARRAHSETVKFGLYKQEEKKRENLYNNNKLRSGRPMNFGMKRQ